MAEANRVIATAGIISVAVGSVNAVGKDKRLPSSRFLIGTGVAFLLLSALADAEPELAKAFAIAICTTVVLGEGGGVLSYINKGEMDTHKRPDKTPDAGEAVHATVGTAHRNVDKSMATPDFDSISIPNLMPTR